MAKRGRKPKRRVNWEKNKGVVASAIALLFLLLGGLSLLALAGGITGGAGTLGVRLNTKLVEYFGFTSVFVPFILLGLGFKTIGTFHWKILKTRLLAGLILMFIAVAGLFGEAGGLMGLFLKVHTSYLISTPGAILLYLFLFTFAVVILSRTGINDMTKKIADIIEIIRPKLMPILGKFMPSKTLDHEAEVDSEISDSDRSLDYLNSPAVKTSKEDDSSFQIISPPVAPVPEDQSPLNETKVHKTDQLIASNSTQLQNKENVSSSLPFSNKVWEYPPLNILLDNPNRAADAGNIQDRAKTIENTLKAFGIKAKIADVSVGPAVTRYALDVAIGTKASKIQSVNTDIALRLKSPSGSVRIVAPIPGTNLVGIEVPNFTQATVSLKSVLTSSEFKNEKSKLKIAIGLSVSGKPIVQDVGEMPHLLIAGATGSGKSVMLNAIIASVLFNCSPQECKFIMIDPKLVELSDYNKIPHLLTPVITDVEQKAVSALAWAMSEMDRRYRLFASANVRNLEAFNTKAGFQAEPYILIIVDELADMMMVAPGEVEKYITRLAQKSRATGIHLILATQRPSVNVITGTIKANIPARIAFKVTSNTDSRVIIDQAGAETLIGRGDMLYVPPTDSKPQRIQGVYVQEKEITKLVEYLRNNDTDPVYNDEVTEQNVKVKGKSRQISEDEKFREALEIICADRKASASYLQRKLGIGYSRAARMIDDMEDMGIIGQARGSKPRKVLITSIEDVLNREDKRRLNYEAT